MNQKILVITDVSADISFIKELKSVFPVEAVDSLEVALHRIRLCPSDYFLAIVKNEMPTPKAYSVQETLNGQNTGIVFYRKDLSKMGIPTILWSRDDGCTDEINELSQLNEKGKRNVVFVKKESEDNHLLLAVTELLPSLV